MQEQKLAFGPMVGLPSTDWVGRDIGEYLSKEHDVLFFDSFKQNICADVFIVIKLCPSIQWIISKKNKGARIIYIPVDFFSNTYKIIAEREKLRLFDMVCIHNENLGKEIQKYTEQLYFIEHYLKYDLYKLYKKNYTYKQDGFILWVGHLEYLPSLLKKVQNIQFNYPLLILSDLENLESMRDTLIRELSSDGILYTEEKINHNKYIICNFTIEQWTEKKQASALLECKAAFDTKNYDSFAHGLKPPTKAQKYIFNNIPFAMDESSYSSEYFSKKGLSIPSINNQKRWFSQDYFNEINVFCKKYKNDLRLDSVANEYMKVIQKISCEKKEGNNNLTLLMVRDFINKAIGFSLKMSQKLRRVCD